MRRGSFVNRTWMSVLGAATLVTSTVAATAPLTGAAPNSDTTDAENDQRAADRADGTYESCAAYFGFGKYDGGLDIVDFDVSDDSGDDGATHAVDVDTQVVLVLTNAAGDELECTPFEVTETMWDEAMDDLDLNMLGFSPDHPLPSWPGPGHYAYPTVNFEPYVAGGGVEPGTDFGTVTGVSFRVTSIPDGHTLTSPTGVRSLAVHFPGGGDGSTLVEDPLVIDYLTSTAGAAAAAAFSAALLSCDSDTTGPAPGPPAGAPPVFDTDLAAAVNALNVFRGYGPDDPAAMACWMVEQLNGEVSLQLGIGDTPNYLERIILSLVAAPTTVPPTTAPPVTGPPATQPQPTTPATTAPSTTAPATTSAPTTQTPTTAAAAVPVTGTPTYTG